MGPENGLFHCPLEQAKQLAPQLPWGQAPILSGIDYIADVKVHKLMPNQWPCIPNWHRDFVPRDYDTLQEMENLIDLSQKMFMWMSGPPLTEFQDGREVKPCTWITFTQEDWHRGIAATKHCWRTFIRLVPAEMMRAGLPGESIPAASVQWVRRHSQVYLDVNAFKW